MTIESQLRLIGTREARAGLRSLVEQVAAGSPVGVLAGARPMAVLLRPDEAGRWERVERSLSALHGAGVYPELASDTSQLASTIGGSGAPSAASLRRLARAPRQILSAAEYIGLHDVRVGFAGVLEHASTRRPVMIVSYGRPVALLIGFAEYQRLNALLRVVSWFSAAGLDLAAASTEEVIGWLADFRSRPPQSSTANEASA